MKTIRTSLISAGTNAIWLLTTMNLNCCSFSSKASKKLLSESGGKSYDVVVVPGAPFENGRWDKVLKARIYWSKYLFDAGIAKNVMFSGSSVYSPYYEAKIMALYGEAIGIPREHILMETRAEHSTENIFYSYKKAISLHFTSVALASDPFQTKMLRKFTRSKVSDTVALLPIVFDTLKTMESQMTDPSIDFQQAFNKDFVPITKRESFWKRIRGTMGLNRDKHAYE